MNLKEWAELIGEEHFDEQDPWVCIDEYDQVAIVAAEKVEAAWKAWETAACDEDPARREWLAMLTTIDQAEVAIAGGWGCQCYECQRAERRVAGYRGEARVVAGEFGLPSPPAEGRIPRYPVNADQVREKGRRLAVAGAVWRRARDIYVVAGDTGAYYVRTHGCPDLLDWECCCPWAQPQGKGQRPGAGCAHVHALHVALVCEAAADALRAA